MLAWLGVGEPAYAQATAEAAAPAQPTDVGAPGSNTSKSAKASDETDTIVVMGVRGALATAQSIKKNAPTIVNSVHRHGYRRFSRPIGSRSAPAHSGHHRKPSAVGRRQHPSVRRTDQVLIRGLTYVRTEFNGRDSFSADSARGLKFNDVSPELLAGIDAYKNETADMIEGGIAGTVNLRTRLPFDQKGLVIAGNVKANYGSRSKKWTPEFSGAGQRHLGHRGRPFRTARRLRVEPCGDTHRKRDHRQDRHLLLGWRNRCERQRDREQRRQHPVHRQSFRRFGMGIRARRHSLFTGQLRPSPSRTGALAGQYENTDRTHSAPPSSTSALSITMPGSSMRATRSSTAAILAHQHSIRALRPSSVRPTAPARCVGPNGMLIGRSHAAPRQLARIMER